MPSNAADRISVLLGFTNTPWTEQPATITGTDGPSSRTVYSFGEVIAYADGRGVWVRADRSSTHTTNKHIAASYDAMHAAGLKFSNERAEHDGRPFRLMWTPEAMLSAPPSSAELDATGAGGRPEKAISPNRPDVNANATEPPTDEPEPEDRNLEIATLGYQPTDYQLTALIEALDYWLGNITTKPSLDRVRLALAWATSEERRRLQLTF